jgi:hypothetical protein
VREEFLRSSRLLVTHVAVCRQRRKLTLLVVTREAHFVSYWSSLRRLFALRLRVLMAVGAIRIGVLVMWEGDVEFGDEAGGLRRCEKSFAKTGKHVPRCVARCCFHVTVRTDLWDWSLAREELLSMTVKTGHVFGKLGDIRKCCITFANFLPVFSRNFVTCIAREFLFPYVSAVRKVGVISARLSKSETDHHEC